MRDEDNDYQDALLSSESAQREGNGIRDQNKSESMNKRCLLFLGSDDPFIPLLSLPKITIIIARLLEEI